MNGFRVWYVSYAHARLRGVLTAGLFLLCHPSASAQMTLERFYPPIVQSGIATTITSEGKFPDWPPEIRCDRQDVRWTPLSESGKWRVTVAKDAAPGVAWARVHDRRSASQWKPLLITGSRITAEAEPNDRRSAATPLALPTVAYGKLEKRGDSDAFLVNLSKGDRLVASVTAHQVLRSPMDSVLQLADLRGNVLAQVDDVRGLDPQLVYTADQDGERLIRLFAFPETPNSTVGFAGSSASIYAMTVTTGPFLDHAFAGGDGRVIGSGDGISEVVRVAGTDVSPETAFTPGAEGWSWLLPQDKPIILPGGEAAAPPVAAVGHLESPGEVHAFLIAVEENQKYRAHVRSKSDGFLFDSKLSVVDTKSGNELASNDDASRNERDSKVEFVARQTGELEVRLSDMTEGYGPRHFYRLVIEAVQPNVRLSVDTDCFVAGAKETLEVSVNVVRDSGYKRNIRVNVEGLPEGFAFSNAVSEPKGPTAKSVKLKLSDRVDAGWSGPISIVGTELDGEGRTDRKPIRATFTLRPAIQLSEFWLVVPPQDSDQTTNE